MNNIFSSLPETLDSELFEDLVIGQNLRIERIISFGQRSPAEGWYDQTENEWVIVLSGAGALLFDNGDQVVLKKGDYINIPAHTKHRVLWTDPDEITVWIAVHYSSLPNQN